MIYGRTIRFLVNILATIAGFSTLAVQAADLAVTLAWSPSPSSDTAGYRLYYGGRSGDYTNSLDVGNTTIAKVPGLAVGATYFFAVTALDVIGLESTFSDEIRYMVPAGARIAAQALALGQMLLTGQGPVGYVYDIQASADFQSWSRIASVTMDSDGTFQATIPNIATTARRWYRLRQTSP
jgi:hypothetical protein